MIKRLLLISFAALTFIAIGCSDDNGTDSRKQTGDPNDPEFQAAMTAMTNLSGGSFEFLGEIYGTIGTIAAGPSAVSGRNAAHSAQGVGDTIIYHESSQYWYHGMGWSDTSYVADTMVITQWNVSDSVQFRHSGVPVQYPDSALVTSLIVGARRSGYSEKSDDSLATGLAVTISGAAGELAAGGDAVIDGAGYFRGTLGFFGPDAGCEFDFLFTENYNDIGLNLDNVFEGPGCPTSGSLVHAGSLDIYCAGLSDTIDVAGNWSAGFTFSASTISYVFENATTRWTGSTTCDELHGDAVSTPLARFGRLGD